MLKNAGSWVMVMRPGNRGYVVRWGVSLVRVEVSVKTKNYIFIWMTLMIFHFEQNEVLTT